MSEISIKIYCLNCNVDDFLEYMYSVDGIVDVKIDLDNEEIYVKYNSDIIGINVLKIEILLFLDLLHIPSIDSFDKYFKKELCKYVLIIKDLCCEHCLRGMIDELIMNSYVGRVNHNFDGINKKDVEINIYYDSDLVNKDELLDIENKFNHFGI